MSLLIVGCDAEKAEQDPSEVGSTKSRPILTVTPSIPNGNVEEGQTITFTISIDRAIANDINFKASLVGGTATEADVELGDLVTIASYDTETTITITIVDDMIPEDDETATIRIEPAGVDSVFWISPHNTLPEFNYTIKSSVNPTDLVVALAWDGDVAPDMDMFVFNEIDGPWSLAASDDNPEVTNVILGDEPDGAYYIGFDPYDVNSGVETLDYSFIIGTPDGAIKTISGTFDYSNRDDTYQVMEWVDGTVVYLLLKVVKDGLNYVVTPL